MSLFVKPNGTFRLGLRTLICLVLLTLIAMSLYVAIHRRQFVKLNTVRCMTSGDCKPNESATTNPHTIDLQAQIRNTVNYETEILNLHKALDEIKDKVFSAEDEHPHEGYIGQLQDQHKILKHELKNISTNLELHASQLIHLNNTLELLQTDMTTHKQDVKVLLFTYMRSGSTFVGQLLNANTDVSYWFEPLGGLYSHLYFTLNGIYPIDATHYTNGTKRIIPEFEHQFLADNLLALLNCDYENVAVETMFAYRGLDDFNGIKDKDYSSCLTRAFATEHIAETAPLYARHRCDIYVKSPCTIENFTRCHTTIDALSRSDPDLLKQIESNSSNEIAQFRDRFNCMSTLKKVSQRCVKPVRKLCAVKTKALKVIRLTMDTVETILQKDNNVKIIHLLRDPRGILHSRRRTGLLSRLKRPEVYSKLVTEAVILCNKMMNDIKTRKILEVKYPNNFLEVRYESVAIDPEAKYKEIYSFLGLDSSPEVEGWINASSNSSESQREMAFGTVRHNSTQTAYSWKTDLKEDVLQQLTNVCQHVLEYLQ